MKMKKLTAMLIVLMYIFSFPVVFAQEDDATSEEDAGVGPDSILHGLDKAMEKIRLALTFNEESKAKLHLKYALERRAEAKAMAKMNNTEAAARSAEEAESQVEEAVTAKEKAKAKGKDVSKIEVDIKSTSRKNAEVLMALLDGLPEQARKGAERALEKEGIRKCPCNKSLDATTLFRKTSKIR